MIKRIVDGNTFNTETATRVCSAPAEILKQHGASVFDVYASPGGSYFVVWVRNRIVPGASEPTTEVEALVKEDMRLLLEGWGRVDLAEKLCGLTEADCEQVAMTVRAPAWLSDQVAEQAKEDGRTKNSAMLRAAEMWLKRRVFRESLDSVGEASASVSRKLEIIQRDLDRLGAESASHYVLSDLLSDLENIEASRSSMSLLVLAAGG